MTSLVNGGWGKQVAREIVASVVAETRAEEQRWWAARIRETGTAKGWSTWAAAFIDPDVEFVDTDMPATETIVAELRRLDRADTLRDVWTRLLAERRQQAGRALFSDGIAHAASLVEQWAADTERRAAPLARATDPDGA